MPAKNTFRSLFQTLLLIAFGCALGIGLIALVLTRWPVAVDTQPTRTEGASRQLDVEFYFADGDLFAWMPGRIAPLEENRLVARYQIAWDDDGFRVPAALADAYPIVALGDSFTEAPNAPLPWPDVVAQQLGIPVRNLGYRAYGPRDNTAVAEEFVAGLATDWVLYGHFAGNDIAQAEAPNDDVIAERNPAEFVPFLAGRALETLESNFAPTADHYDYPMPTIIGPNYYDLALVDDYMFWQIAPEAGFEATRAYTVISDALDRITATVAPETCKAFIFMPPKGALYFPYLRYTQADLLNIGTRPRIEADRVMRLRPYDYDADDPAAFIARLTDQRDAMRNLAEERGWFFIDLLEPFESEVATGALLYYRYDTHWNQAGHDLAGTVIADFMSRSAGCRPLSG